MIWVRRILAIPLIIIFVITFILALVLNHVSGTVGSAGFYNGQMDKAKVYSWVYDNLAPAALDQVETDSPTDFPIDTPGLKKDIIEVVAIVFPPEWLEETFEGATKEAVPYAVGNNDGFAISIGLDKRIDEMVKAINGEEGVVDDYADVFWAYVRDELIVPEITQRLESGADLPYGITLTDEEIEDFVAQAIPQSWAIDQLKSIVETVAEYLKGGADSLDFTIYLTPVITGADDLLTTLANQKVEDTFNSLPPDCTEAEFALQLASLPPDTLPTCRPESYEYDDLPPDFKTEISDTIAAAVDDNVIGEMPDSYSFDDAELRDSLGEDMSGTLHDAREFIVDDGGRITEADLANLLGSDDTEEFDDVRHTVHTVRTWLWALWLIPILLLVAIGFLCGRNWKSRLLWPLSVLLVTSLILVIVLAVARTIVPDRIVERPDEGEDATQVGIVIADKADEIAHNAINTIVWGLEVKLIICIVVSALAMGGVIAWYIVEKRRRRQMEQGTPAATPAQT